MGFSLHGYLVFRLEAVTLFDRMFPGSARFAHRVPVSGDGPEGWLLPRPMRSWPVEDAAHEQQMERLEEAVGPWRSLPQALGLPEVPSPRGDELDWLLCALLSLAGGPGVVELFDETFGGVICDEFASAWKDGRFVAAAASPEEGKAYAIGPREASKQETPVAWCAAHLDPAFTGRFLYDGYFPRRHDEVPDHVQPPLPPVHIQWPEGWPEAVRDVLNLTS